LLHQRGDILALLCLELVALGVAVRRDELLDGVDDRRKRVLPLLPAQRQPQVAQGRDTQPDARAGRWSANGGADSSGSAVDRWLRRGGGRAVGRAGERGAARDGQ
jgi:hypothetical protein